MSKTFLPQHPKTDLSSTDMRVKIKKFKVQRTISSKKWWKKRPGGLKENRAQFAFSSACGCRNSVVVGSTFGAKQLCRLVASSLQSAEDRYSITLLRIGTAPLVSISCHFRSLLRIGTASLLSISCQYLLLRSTEDRYSITVAEVELLLLLLSGKGKRFGTRWRGYLLDSLGTALLKFWVTWYIMWHDHAMLIWQVSSLRL